MNKLTLIILTLFMVTGSLHAQPFQSRSYQTGNFIFCGKEIPKGFSYLIERKNATTSAWEAAAVLKAPKNEAECKASLMNLPESVAAVNPVRNELVHHFWQRLQLSATLDSLFAYGTNPTFQDAAGTGWFDNNIRKTGEYVYRISKVDKKGTVTVINEITLSFPGKNFRAGAQPVRFKLNAASIDISYGLSDTLNTAAIKVFRSPYKQNRFLEIAPTVLFTQQNKQIVALINDASVITGLTYSYIAIPYDALGNAGQASDTLNIYNTSKPSDVGIITSFDAVPVKEKQGILLSWKLKEKLNITSIEVYRSTNYDSGYTQIASLPPNALEFLDNQGLRPATAYFYYIVINNGYGNSLPSARTPAILEGNRPNLIPPQNLTIKRCGRLVTLKFERADRNTRAYYVYRANGYVAPLRQLTTMKLSSDSMMTYTDTLPYTREPEAYSYAVASVNTSYNISPLSERVSTMFGGGQLPIADNLNIRNLDGNLFITWDNVSEQHAGVMGYRIMRSVLQDGKIMEPEKPVAFTDENTNSYTDTSVEEGFTYSYRIQCQGLDSTELGSVSQLISKNIPVELPLPPGQVSALASDNKIILKWTLPFDNKTEKVRIYRAEINKKASLLKELDKTEKYEDQSVGKGIYYFYYLATVDKKGRESRPADPVSTKL